MVSFIPPIECGLRRVSGFGGLACAGRQRAGRHRHGDQDRPDHALQRPRLGPWRVRAHRGRLFQDDQRAGRRERPQAQSHQPRRRLQPAENGGAGAPPRRAEQVAFLFQTLRTAPNAAIRQYLNDNKAPQLFVVTGAAMFSDPQQRPSLRTTYHPRPRSAIVAAMSGSQRVGPIPSSASRRDAPSGRHRRAQPRR